MISLHLLNDGNLEVRKPQTFQTCEILLGKKQTGLYSMGEEVWLCDEAAPSLHLWCTVTNITFLLLLVLSSDAIQDKWNIPRQIGEG